VIEQAKFCANCGKPLTPGDKFCGVCGAPVDVPAPGKGEEKPEAPKQTRRVEIGAAPPTQEAAGQPKPEAGASRVAHQAKPAAAGAAMAQDGGNALTRIPVMGAIWGIGWAVGALIGGWLFWQFHLDYSNPYSPLMTDLFFVWGMFGLVAGLLAEGATVFLEGERRLRKRSMRSLAALAAGWAAVVLVIGIAGGNGLVYALGLGVAGGIFGWLAAGTNKAFVAAAWAGSAFVLAFVQHTIQ
jgi:hypothetical protein